MVWNSTGSTLYKAVERHNSDTNEPPPVYEAPPERPCQTNEIHSHGQSGSPLSKLVQDRDILLIAAILLLLVHEKADTKLILALAFVIFS